MPVAYLRVAVLAGPKKGALVYPKRPCRGIHKLRQFPLRQTEQIDQFVADQASVKREECGQEEPRSQTIHEAGLGQVYQDENAECRHRKFRAREHRRSVRHDGVHDGIRLYHPPIQELEGQERIGTGQQHGSRCKKEQPGVVPVQKNDFGVGRAPMGMAAGQRKAIYDGAP